MRGFVVGLLVVAACASSADDGVTDETEVGGDQDVKADAASDLEVRAGDTTLTVSPVVARRGDAFVLHGRTSRTLTAGHAFTRDGDYGMFAQLSPRTFEVTWPVASAAVLVDGIDQLVGMDFVHSSGKPDHLTARAVVRPRLGAIAGSSKIYLTAELTPVNVAGLTVFRIAGHTTVANADIHASIGTVARIDNTKFQIDLTAAQVFAGGAISVTAALSSGGVERHAQLGLAVKKLGLTAADPLTHWPAPRCTNAIRACLTALPDGALDLGNCGEALAIDACAGTIGATVDDSAFQATLHDANARLATPAARADAVSLAGADRADMFLGGESEVVEAHLEPLFGAFFASTTARTATLAATVDTALVDAAARPLDLVTPHAPAPGDAAAERQVVADAVLAELAAMDFAHSEFARPLEAIVADHLAAHIADIGAFRTTVSADPDAATPTDDFYIASWLGLYTEVQVTRATGVVSRVLVEID